MRTFAVADAHEREADRAADSVTGATGLTRYLPSKTVDAGTAAAPSSVDEALASPARALDAGTRSFFERRFGHDFSGVRVHADGMAAQSARDAGALAYTSGRDIVFGAGQFAPETHAGRRLIAHELAHVIQQSNASPASAVVQRQQGPAAQAPPRSEGARIREANRAAAESWLQKAEHGEGFIDQATIDDIHNGVVTFHVAGVPIRFPLMVSMSYPEIVGAKRPSRIPHVEWKQRQTPLVPTFPLRTPNPSFTTCIEFAGRTLRDAATAEHQGNPAAVLRLARLLPEILKIIFNETDLHRTAGLLNHNLKRLDADPRVREAEEAAAQSPTAQVREQLKIIKEQREKIQGEITKTAEQLDELDKHDDAWIKPEAGLRGGRPQPGDFVLLGQATTGSFAVPGTATEVPLAAGAFQHICVLLKIEDVDAGRVEKWRTADGGGVTAEPNEYYVRLSDLLVFRQPPPRIPPKNPWSGPQPVSALMGWIDVEKLVNGATSL
jgi:uncharacterized protein DUF4157